METRRDRARFHKKIYSFSFFFSLDGSLYRIVCVYYDQTVHCVFSVSSSVCVAFVVVVSIFFSFKTVFFPHPQKHVKKIKS